jgi:2-polyprenyl-3-methyl-5-hydroxy-6-metoxy-1,4-benzoquinol methylase
MLWQNIFYTIYQYNTKIETHKTTIRLVSIQHILFYAFFASIFLLNACKPGSDKENNQTQSFREKENVADSATSRSNEKDKEDLSEKVSDFDELIKEYENPEREEWQNPGFILEKLEPLDGKTVADIGAGTGYFTFRLARRAKKVIAVEIDEQFLEYIEDQKLRQNGTTPRKIETRLTTTDDSGLNDNEADRILMVNVYSYIDNRVEYMTRLREKFKRDGFLVVVDYKESSEGRSATEISPVSIKEVQQELIDAGYKIVEIDNESLKYQYLLVAQPGVQ